MISLIFIIVITGTSIFITYSISPDISWFDYYKGGLIGLLISGIILKLWNKKQVNKDEKKKTQIP